MSMLTNIEAMSPIWRVAEMVAFLATSADFMTGQMLVIDGGETMR